MLLDRVGDKLRSVVATDEGRSVAFGHESVESAYHVGGGD